MITEKLKLIAKVLAKKHVGIPLLVIGTALITMTAVLALVDHGAPANNSRTLVKGASTEAERNASTDQESTGTTDTSTKTSSNDVTVQNKAVTSSGATQASPKSTPANQTTTPAQEPKTTPTKPTQPSGSIVFSNDGCFVTMTGAPGWILTGIAEFLDEDGIPRKGGPLGDPEGYIIPASGSAKVEVGFPGYDWAGWRLAATLSDQSGNQKASKTFFVDPASAAVCP